jgi:hypothetical protein
MPATVLSLSFDREKLRSRQAALEAGGFKVVSVVTAGQAWFEIDTGQCEIFLTCGKIPENIIRDLVSLFRNRCSGGTVILVGEGSGEHYADIIVPESDDPEGIVKALGMNFRAKAS